jgi:hypothetical protein
MGECLVVAGTCACACTPHRVPTCGLAHTLYMPGQIHSRRTVQYSIPVAMAVVTAAAITGIKTSRAGGSSLVRKGRVCPAHNSTRTLCVAAVRLGTCIDTWYFVDTMETSQGQQLLCVPTASLLPWRLRLTPQKTADKQVTSMYSVLTGNITKYSVAAARLFAPLVVSLSSKRGPPASSPGLLDAPAAYRTRAMGRELAQRLCGAADAV